MSMVPSLAAIAEPSTVSARRAAAFAMVDITPTVRVRRVIETDRTLIVAAERPDAFFPFTVDAFRVATAEETDPEQTDPLAPGEWVLIDQIGGHGPDEIDVMLSAAQAYLVESGLIEDVADEMVLGGAA